MPPHARPLPSDRKGDGIFATKLGFYLLWMEYLALSPSYELARRYRTNTFTTQDERRKPADFNQVLAVYDDLGDVQSIEFLEWWRDRGMPVFGYKGEKPRLRRIGVLQPERDKLARQGLRKFIETSWEQQGRPNSALVSIPLGLTRSQIMRQLRKQMDALPAELKEPAPGNAKYPLMGKRQRKDSLFRYIYVVWMRYEFPKEPLWRVGARAYVSNSENARLDPGAEIQRGEKVDERNVLAALTSRAYSRGIALAENAARGRFPCHTPCEHAVIPDLEEMRLLQTRRRKWRKLNRRLRSEQD